jgi:Flp pilus assembly protein TadD
MYYLIALAFVTLFAPIATAVEAEEMADIERRLAEDPTNISLIVTAGRAYLNDAQQGEGAAMKKAEELLDRALSLAPDNPQILVLHGSMLALKGRDARLPVMKMRHVQNGLKEMDRAVELAPMDFGIRYQRGAYCLNLPDIFQRAGTAVEDFEQLLKMASQVPDSVSNEEAISIRLSLAQAKLKVGDVEAARSLLETISTEMPGTAYADRAKAILDKIDG